VSLDNGEILVLDAGSGIRILGNDLVGRDCDNKCTLLLTHVHWDHIQGFPFFTPAYLDGSFMDIYGLPKCHNRVDLLLSNQMQETYFPVNIESLRAEMRFHDLSIDEPIDLHGATVRTMRVNHTTETVGFRIEADDQALVYIPDNEINFCSQAGRTSYEDLVAFCSDADVLIHDAQYTEANYLHRVGWGHSTRNEAIKLARDAGARTLLAFHHDPMASDSELAAWEATVSLDLDQKGLSDTLTVFAAREQQLIDLAPLRAPALSDEG
jgi:phosphoribosyl 1,2-cyclic phosphodiesterase